MLDRAISSSLTSMDRSKQEFSIAAHNIANANEAHFSALKLNVAPIVTGNLVGGVEVVSVSTEIDTLLQGRLYDKISTDSYNQTIEQFYKQVTNEFGAPSSAFSLDSRLSTLFNALDKFSYDTSAAGLKQTTVIEFTNVANSISQIANHLQQLRFDVDKEISNSVADINNLLSQAFISSQTINILPTGSIEYANAMESFRLSLEGISQYFNLYQYNDDKGQFRVFTTEGEPLVGDLQHFLKYVPLNGSSDLINNTPINPLLLSAYDSAGTDLHIDFQISNGGLSENIINKHSSGKFGALLTLRDKLIPNTLNQLDILAKNIKDQFNIAHNAGSGFPPPNTLQGNNLLTYDQVLGFTGNVRIAVVDNDGHSIPNISTFNLNLSALDTGLGPGNANVEGIIQEIQYHYGSRLAIDKSIAIGNLSDIKLASLTKVISPGQTFNLDLELTNLSATTANVQIQTVTAQDFLGNNILGSFNNSSYVSIPGQIARTTGAGPSIALNLPSNVNYPFTVNVEVNITEASTNYLATLRYIIDNPIIDNINGALNQRFSISSKVNVSDPGVINGPALTQPVLNASLINITNHTIPIGPQSSGLLQLSTSNSNYHIVIDSLDSYQLGYQNGNILGTGQNFSCFMGLNDLFVRTDDPSNWNNIENCALYLDIRDDIKSNSGYLSHSSLIEEINSTQPNVSTYKYGVSASNDDTVKLMQALATTNVFFSAAGGLPSYQSTLAKYAQSLIAFSATTQDSYESNAKESELVRSALYDRIQNIRGVDINQEMANMIIYQQSFAASAKVIQITRELMQSLLDII